MLLMSKLYGSGGTSNSYLIVILSSVPPRRLGVGEVVVEGYSLGGAPFLASLTVSSLAWAYLATSFSSFKGQSTSGILMILTSPENEVMAAYAFSKDILTSAGSSR